MNLTEDKSTSFPEEFVTLNDAIKIVGFEKIKLKSVIEEIGITTKTITNNGRKRKIYSKKELENFKKELDTFWYEHIVLRTVVKTYSEKISKEVTKIEIPSIYKISSAKYVVSLKEIQEIERSLEDENCLNTESFITIYDAVEIVGFHKRKLQIVLEDIGIITKIITVGTAKKKLYFKEEVENFKKDLETFWSEHIVVEKVAKNYGKKMAKMVTKIKIPSIYNISSAKYVVSLKEVQEINYSLKNDYLLYAEAIEILSLNQDNFTKTIKEFLLTKERLSTSGNELGFLKEEIYSVKKKQEEFFLNALTYDYVYNTYGPSITLNVECYPIPYYARCSNNIFYNKNTYYKKEDIELYIKNKKRKEKSISIKMDTLFNTYMARLNSIEFNGFEGRPYSSQKWNNFVSRKLSDSKSSKETNDRNISKYIKSCIYLFDFLDNISFDKRKEVYSLSTSEINFLLNTLSFKYSQTIYLFLKEVAQDIQLNKVSSKSRGFNFDKITSPYKTEKNRVNIEDLESEIYTFIEYMEIFSFLTNIELHLNRFSNIYNNFHKTRYLSTWLYLSIQLTNTWRKGDVCDFPKLNWDAILIEEKIFNIDWFYQNKISKDVGRRVISILNKHTFFMNKTGASNSFRASDEVSQLLATILFLLDLNYKELSVIENYEDDKIMYFGTKYNKPEQNVIDNFFKGINLVNFKFKSTKMTKSILSYTKIISPAEYGILVPKHQRAHRVIGSTLHYVKMPKEYMDFLSEQLFERGEFGYIYDTLLGMIIGNKDRDYYIKERTELIKTIQRTFGDVHKLESSLKLSIFHTQTEVIDMLYSKGLDECNNILSNIHFNNLPSKEKHIQCLCSESGCLHPERDIYPKGDGCVGCEYSIPNIYAITILANRLKHDLKDYSSTSNKIVKRKLSMRIFKYKEVLKDAIKKYGKDYIYSCIGIDMTREEFISSLKIVGNPLEVATSPLNKLIGDNR